MIAKRFVLLFICITGLVSLFGQYVFEGFRFGPRYVNDMIEVGNLLYIATDVGLMIKDLDNGSIQHLHPGNSAIKPPRVTCFTIQANGTLWIGTSDGLYRLQNGIISRYMASSISGEILCLDTDSNNMVWIGKKSGTGLCLINQSETFIEVASFKPNTIRVDSSSYIWFGYSNSMSYSLIRYKHSTGVFDYFDSDNSILPDNSIRSIKKDSANNIWVLSRLGLTKIQPSGEWFGYGGDWDHVLALGIQMDVDDLDQLWITKKNSLVVFNGVDAQSIPASQLGTGSHPIKSVKCGSSVYYGAMGHLGTWNGDQGTVDLVYNLDLAMNPLISLQDDGTTRLWATYGYHIDVSDANYFSSIDGDIVTNHSHPLNFSGGHWLMFTDVRNRFYLFGDRIYHHAQGEWSMVSQISVGKQAVYNQGIAYFPMGHGGLFCHSGTESWTVDLDLPGTDYSYAANLCVDQQGRLWFTNNNRLFSYQDSVVTSYPPIPGSGYVQKISVDNAGWIWIGRYGGIVYKYTGRDYVGFPTIPYNSEFRQILFGNSGEIWFMMTKGVYLWTASTGYQLVMPYFDGETILIELVKQSEGRVLIVTSNGYHAYRYTPPSSIDENIASVSSQLLVYPNPSASALRIEALDGKQIKNVAVYNLRGQVVYSNNVIAASQLIWNGKDHYGNSVSSGVYFIKAEIDGKHHSQKILITK